MFDYFYGAQAEQFAFYRVPKVLFTNDRFKYLSAEAKTLYGILLDRVPLSAKNGWIDEQGRVYIICTIEEIMEDMNCGNKIEGSLPADASDEQKTAFENLMKRMTTSNQNIDPNTFWNTYNQSKANLHSVINQNALTHYIPVQIRITLENALKKYNAIQVIGCEGYRKLKKIANRKF